MARFYSFLIFGALLYFSVLVSGKGITNTVHAGAPVNLRTTSIQATTVNLAWDDGAVTCKDTLDGQGSLKTYSVSSSPAGRQKCNVLTVAGSPAKSASCTQLLESTEYTFTVKALCKFTEGTEDPSSTDSAPRVVTTKAAAPSAAESVTVASSGPGQVVVSFQRGQVPCEYFYGEKFVSWVVLESSSSTPLTCKSTGDDLSLSCALPNYSGGKIAVQAKCTSISGKIQYYPYNVYATNAEPPKTSVEATWDTATLTWNVDGVTCENSGSVSDGFLVKVVDSTSDEVVCESHTNGLTYRCNNLKSETTFASSVSVVCKDTTKNSPPASNTFTTYFAATLPVEQLTVTKSDVGVWKLNWEDSTRNCGQFDRLIGDTTPSLFPNDLSIEVEGTPVDNFCSTTSTAGAYESTCTLPQQFVEGKYHKFSVVYRCKNSSHDSVASVLAPESYLGIDPVKLTLLNPSWDDVLLSWSNGNLACEDNESELDYYEVEITSSGQSTSLKFITNNGQLSAVSVSNYTGTVKLVCKDSTLVSTTAFTFTTKPIPPTEPLNVHVTAQNSEMVTVRWSEQNTCTDIHQGFVSWNFVDLNTKKALFCDYHSEGEARCLVDEGVAVAVGVSLKCDQHQSEVSVSEQITVPRSAVDSPSQVTVVDVTDTSAKVNWTQTGVNCDQAGTYFSSWVVQLTAPSQRSFYVQDFNTFGAILSGLTPNTAYTAYVSQNCRDLAKTSEPLTFTFKTGLAASISAPTYINARGSDDLAFAGVYNRVFVDVKLGVVTCEQAGSSFTGFDVQTAALNEAGEGTFKSSVCSQTAANGDQYTFRCEVLPGTKYHVRAATNCARVNLKSAFSAFASFATLDENTKSSKFKDVLNEPSTFSDSAQVQVSTGTFSNSDGVTGVSFGFVSTTKRSAAVMPENTTDIGNLEFVFDAITASGPRPSGFTQGPIVFRFNTTTYGISVEDASHLNLYYVDAATNTWVNAENSCERALRQNWVTSDGLWVVSTCHLSQYKAFYSGIKPVESTSEAVSTQLNTTAASVTEVSGSQNNQVGSSNAEVFVGITTAALIGAIIACILGVLLIAAIILVILWRKHEDRVRRESENTDTEQFEPTIPQGGELGKSVSEMMSRDAESSIQFDKVQRLGLESDEDSAWSSEDDDDDHNETRV